MLKILSVAEKPSVAKEVARIVSDNGQNMSTREGCSRFNKCFDIRQCMFDNRQASMTMTSVSGHMMELDFDGNHRKWDSCRPEDLFNAPLNHTVKEESKDIEKTLIREAKTHNVLFLWLDCDLEGEAIAYEVIGVCTKANPRLDIYRARFSALIPRDIFRTMNHPERPNAAMNDAVKARQEIDLRIGAAFTRWQTKRIQNKYEGVGEKVISYGPCQFPTLGFIIERHVKIEAFRPQDFWSIQAEFEGPDPDDTQGRGKMMCQFSWNRRRLFDRFATVIALETCFEGERGGMAQVIRSDARPTFKTRPVPLNTVELAKKASRFLRMGSDHTLKVAEELYMRGIISYPRTETDFFKEGTDLQYLIREQQGHSEWGNFASGLVDRNGFTWPLNGGHDDQAHPPIHPVKRLELGGNELRNDDERKIYELVTRHFLACCSQNAVGDQTTIEIQVPPTPSEFGEVFSATGLMVKQRNYLDVYKYDRWTAKKVPTMRVGEIFEPRSVMMISGHTTPPRTYQRGRSHHPHGQKGHRH